MNDIEIEESHQEKSDEIKEKQNENDSSIGDEKVIKKHKKPKYTEYSNYIRKIASIRYPEIGMTSGAVDVVNSFTKDLVDRIASRSADLLRYKRTHTMTCREIQTAIHIEFPKDIAMHLGQSGYRAANTFKAQSEIIEDE